MSDFQYCCEELLRPISAEKPCGTDIRYHPLFTEIAEARRADDDLNEGDWEKEGGRKVAEWGRVAQLCIEALREHTKDLRIAGYLTEASVRLDGFAGLRDTLRLNLELLTRFWDQGLFPAIDDGDLEYRASSLAWLNDRLPDVLGLIPITARAGENYGLSRYLQAQRVGSEAAMASASAERRATIEGLIRQGWIKLDQFEAALRDTPQEALQAIFDPLQESESAVQQLEKVTDEKFGRAAPTLSSLRETLSAIHKLLAPALKKKEERPPDRVDNIPEPHPGTTKSPLVPVVRTIEQDAVAVNGQGWTEAEALLRAGRLEQALSMMAGLASRETSGRARFVRKLMLCDVCLANGRERLARTVLEELNQQIDEFKLDKWESSELVGAVWSRLYKIYGKADESKAASDLYDRLCRLDPWQTYLNCED
jgi:type VI secretion system protein ImpA